MNLWATKSITSLRAEADSVSERSLRRHLGPWGLTALGIGAIIGAGLFVRTAAAAGQATVSLTASAIHIFPRRTLPAFSNPLASKAIPPLAAVP